MGGDFLSKDKIDREFFKTYLEEKPPGPQSHFQDYHFELVLRYIGENEPIGRNRLASDLGLGSGSIRSIMKALKKEDLIDSNPKGHSLTDRGKVAVKEFQEKIPNLTREIELPPDIAISKYHEAILIRNAANKIKQGMDQTIAALKMDAKGALTIIFKNNTFIIPELFPDLSKKFPNFINTLKKQHEFNENDVLVIGSGDNYKQALLGAWAAVYTLID